MGGFLGSCLSLIYPQSGKSQAVTAGTAGEAPSDSPVITLLRPLLTLQPRFAKYQVINFPSKPILPTSYTQHMGIVSQLLPPFPYLQQFKPNTISFHHSQCSYPDQTLILACAVAF